MSVHTGRVMNRADFEHEVALGLITKEDKVELLAGRIVDVMTEGPPHVAVITELMTTLVRALDPTQWQVRAGHPIALSDIDMPEPDLAVARQRTDRYGVAHPRPDDLMLLVEVSDSSRKRDLSLKAERHALAGIVEYWVVDLVERRTVVHHQPSIENGSWTDVTVHGAGTVVTALAFPELELVPLE